MKKIRFKWIMLMEILLIIFWGAQLIQSDAYYVNYVVILVITGICCHENIQKREFVFRKSCGKYANNMINIFAILFSCMVAFANYKLWASIDFSEEFGFHCRQCYKAFMAVIFLFGGFCALWNIFYVIALNLKLLFWKENKKEINPRHIFLLSFILLVLTRWIVLVFCQYPGELSPDSINQMSQLTYGTYSNHHPFYHTMVIKCFVSLGMAIFNDIEPNHAPCARSFFIPAFSLPGFSFIIEPF